MVESKPAEYFNKLLELLTNLEVTGRKGDALSLDNGTQRAVEMFLAIKSGPGKVMLIGNGGSAAIASHMQNDLCKAVGARAMVFNEPPLLTALTNDLRYEEAFEKLVELWAKGGDILVAISSSGQSENILRAVRTATARNCQVITLSGFKPDNPLRGMGDLNFYVASPVYGYVEPAHSTLAHYLTDCAATLANKEPKNV